METSEAAAEAAQRLRNAAGALTDKDELAATNVLVGVEIVLAMDRLEQAVRDRDSLVGGIGTPSGPAFSLDEEPEP